MKIRTFLQRESLQILLLALPFALAAAWWGKFPPAVATHWGLDGQPNGWMPKAPGLLLPPTVNVGVCLLLAFLPKIDLRLRRDPAAHTPRYRRVLRTLRLAITGFFALLAMAVMAKAGGWTFDLSRAACNGALGLLIVMGNFLGTLRPSRFTGVRTPWTLRDPETWRATHRLVGRCMVYGSAALLGVQFFVSTRTQAGLLITFTAALVALGVGYSAWFYQRRRLA